jgi:hypothetical protein
MQNYEVRNGINEHQVLDESYELLASMGFEVQQAFDEITNSPEHVSLHQLSRIFPVLTAVPLVGRSCMIKRCWLLDRRKKVLFQGLIVWKIREWDKVDLLYF